MGGTSEDDGAQQPAPDRSGGTGEERSSRVPTAAAARGSLHGVGSEEEELVHHTVGGGGRRWDYLLGACALTAVWGGIHVGALSPAIAALLAWSCGFWPAALFVALAVGSVLVPLGQSPAFCRFYLAAANCTGGASVWFLPSIVPYLEGDGMMVCMHPHGILPLGFSFNGAIRVKACDPSKYLPAGVTIGEKCNGIQAPVLWRVPFMGAVMKLWGTCTPATKQGMKTLLAARTPFGILPGGSDEVAIHEYGKENVYINSRYGFIKYGLEQGYALVVCYTFGESDQYHSVRCLRPLNLWLVMRFGFVLPLFWGKSFFPLLPKGGGLHSVYGAVVQLPKIEVPTSEDVVRWHKVYVDALVGVFERHKGRFGYGDRELRCF